MLKRILFVLALIAVLAIGYLMFAEVSRTDPLSELLGWW